jgi:Enoyl-CoA hydratase/isomerase
MLLHKLSELPVVTIAKIRGRARGAGSELALACDMRFAARENAILGQIEVGVGTTPGAGATQHLARLLGRGRVMEAILGADDFSAEQSERYGWINRALPDADLDAFLARLARPIASFPADAVRSAKRVLNELTMPHADAIRADAPAVPPAGRLGHGQEPHGGPLHPGPADPWPSRTRPRRPYRSPVTHRVLVRLAAVRIPRSLAAFHPWVVTTPPPTPATTRLDGTEVSAVKCRDFGHSESFSSCDEACVKFPQVGPRRTAQRALPCA